MRLPFALFRTTLLAGAIFGLLRLPNVQPQIASAKSEVSIAEPSSSSGDCTIHYPVAFPSVNFPFGNSTDPFHFGKKRFHTGIDLQGALGTPVRSTTCGTVVFAGSENDSKSYDSGYGIHVKIQDSKGRIHLFGHLSKILVKVGDRIQSGQLIGLVGSTGNSTGPHLHYEVRVGGDDYRKAVNPAIVLAKAEQKK